MKPILNIICHLQTEPRADLRQAPSFIAQVTIADLALKPAFDSISFFNFTEEAIAQLRTLHQYRTAETYQAALNSFRQFRHGRDLKPDAIDMELVQAYEAYLKAKGLSSNTISFYNRILRAIYNRAVDKGLTPQRHPFKSAYTGIGKTVKRALPLQVIQCIKNLNLSDRPQLELARDLFLFSFYTRGMAFVDMAYLLKQNLKDGILTYRRQKTGQQLSIRWESCMQDIVSKHKTTGKYLLPIIDAPQPVPSDNPSSAPNDTDASNRNRYLNALYRTNRHLKTIAGMIDLKTPLTMYVSRHSWASIAHSRQIPLSVISAGLGHDSETTTKIYLDELNPAIIDENNAKILNDLM